MTPSQELRFLILAAQRAGSRILMAALKPLGLTPAQAEVLQVVGEYGPITLVTLGGLLVCESGSPSRLVAGLVKRGLVTRSTSREDGRAVDLTLGPEGRTLIEQMRGLDGALAELISSSLSPDEVEAMVMSLRKLLQDAPPGQAVARRRSRT